MRGGRRERVLASRNEAFVIKNSQDENSFSSINSTELFSENVMSLKTGQGGKVRLRTHLLLVVQILLVIIFADRVAADSDTGLTLLDINVYPYLSETNSDNYLTVNLAAKLPHRFSYFSLTNVGRLERGGGLSDKLTLYTEQNIRWKISDTSPLDLTAQLNFRTGSENDRYRLGIRWRLNDTPGISDLFAKLNLKYSLNWHVVQFDHEDADVWQLEHVFGMKFPYLSDRLYLSGFVDHTFNQDLAADFPENPIVAEVQLGFRLFDKVYAISEYRINEYRRTQVENVAVGFQHKITF